MTNIKTFQGDVFIHEYIKHTGDDNNLFGFSGTDTFKIATAGSDRLTVSSSGTVNIPGDLTGSFTLADARIPSLAASKINSGTFSSSRIPSLDTSKLGSGTLSTSRGGTGTTSVTGSGSMVKSSSAYTANDPSFVFCCARRGSPSDLGLLEVLFTLRTPKPTAIIEPSCE